MLAKAKLIYRSSKTAKKQ